MCNENNNNGNTKWSKFKWFVGFLVSIFATYSAIADFDSTNKMLFGDDKEDTFHHKIVIEQVDYTYNNKLIDEYYVSGDVKLIVSYSEEAYACYNVNKNDNVLKNLLSLTVDNAVKVSLKETTYAYFGNYVADNLDTSVEDKLEKVKCYDSSTVEVKHTDAYLYKSYK